MPTNVQGACPTEEGVTRLGVLRVQAEEFGLGEDTGVGGRGMESSLEEWQSCLALSMLCPSDGVLRDTEVR